MRGVPGERGEKGDPGVSLARIAGRFDNADQLAAAHPEGDGANGYLVGGSLYLWDRMLWRDCGPYQIKGDKGEKGDPGEKGERGMPLRLAGCYADLAALAAAHPGGDGQNSYLAGGRIYLWDGAAWADCGAFQGDAAAAERFMQEAQTARDETREAARSFYYDIDGGSAAEGTRIILDGGKANASSNDSRQA